MSALRVALVVLSDRGSRGEREDLSGPALTAWLTGRGASPERPVVLPDERELIAGKLRELCDGRRFDVVLTCGGTGVSPTDVTPEATREVIDLEIPGFGEVMRAAAAGVSRHAMISRALAGARNRVLIVNLPGSPRAALENLAAVWPAVPHAVAKLQGDSSDCADSGRVDS